MVKLLEKLKKHKIPIIVVIIILILIIGIFIFIQIKQKEEEQTNYTQYFETPDRIVYKQKGLDSYYVFSSDQEDYTELLDQLIACIDGVSQGKEISKGAIEQIEQEENYIELDYNTISKNYIIAYEKENYNVIKRTDNGGILVEQTIQHKQELQKLIKEKIKQKEAYHMSDYEEYISNAEITQEQIEENNDLKSYENNIYSKKIETHQELDDFIERYSINPAKEIPDTTFEHSEIIAIISKYDIESVEKRIGGLTFYFTGTNTSSTYNVHLYAVSKAINTNCIYREFANRVQTKTIYGNITKIDGNMWQIQTKENENYYIILNGNEKIVNARTQKQMKSTEVNTGDIVNIWQVIVDANGSITLEENSTITITRNLSGEALKDELLEQEEINTQIIDVKQNNKTITITCKLTDYYYDYRPNEAETFEIKVTVDKDTTILGTTENQLENIQQIMEYNDNTYIKLKNEEKQKGRLVAENIEVMGC